MDADRAATRVFDLIDAHQTSQAEGALQTALQKFPTDDSLRAAEALIELRNGNYSLAKTKAIALSERNVTKPKAVNALVHVLQNCCCWDALVATYERLRPLQNERQISENLVQTYTRMGAFPKAQQLATQLYRQHNDPKYQVWMVQAMLAQVPADSTDHMLLKVATKMLDAAVLSERGHVVPSTVQTYVDVLEQQGHYAAAVDFLLSERAVKIGLLATRLEALARLLRRAGRRSASNAVARHLWTLESDNWAHFTAYRDTLLPASGDGDGAGDGDGDAEGLGGEKVVLEVLGPVPELRATIDCSTANHSLEEAVRLARELQRREEEQHPSKLRRGPYLAELDLLHSLQSPDMHARVLAYVERFYRKPSCYLDLSTFLSPALASGVYQWSLNTTTTTTTTTTAAGAAADVLDMHTRRILGLRCLVGSWESPQPADELRALFRECVEAYQHSRHLSEELAWSEEGLCDGYMVVALNIALRGFAAAGETPEYAFLVQGLDVMDAVDRRLSNPTWLIYAVCFANLLGLTECAALHRLAFKSVQHDTMAHLGYWPLLTGLALTDVASWDDWAESYYSQLERDCSLLRAKVFNYTSWPAMQDVQRYEAAQLNSLYCVQYPANDCVGALLTCQTQKDVHEVFKTRTEAMWNAWSRLVAVDVCDTLVDNTDWLVARSMVLGNIHSAAVRQLTSALVSVPSREWQVRRSRQLLASIFLVHDVAVVSAARAAAAQAGKGRKGKGGHAGGDAASATAAPTLYTPRLAAEPAALEYLPAVQPLVGVLLAYINSQGEATPAGGSGASEALRAYVQSLVADSQHSAGAVEEFIYPQAYLLLALLRVAPAAKVPVKQWATVLREALAAAQHRYEARTWSTLATVVGQAPPASARVVEGIVLPAGGFTARLEAEKVHRVLGFIGNIMAELGAYAR
ncbi:N-acetyltransferase B complex (NatB) non catalytic subunit [Novymonas esmeraldas]|uniref:N-acetyltransferase B complex (NatB) non catalytic subunit n=1 Tax=Novymonas esmeraldas TaxID=1808958 RepID=A0AAW0F5D4_9TRYP